jgi:periplasmic protein CpxP/Spy
MLNNNSLFGLNCNTKFIFTEPVFLTKVKTNFYLPNNFTFNLTKKIKTMKKTIFMTVLMALSAFGSNALMAQANSAAPAQQSAQQGRPMPSAQDRAKRMTDRMNQTAQLTPDQYAKVLQINKDFQAQRDALGSNKQMTDDQRNQMRAAAKDRDAKIKAVLTPEQWQKVQDSKMRPTQGGHPAGQ